MACHKGLSQSLFSGPLRYLRGDNDKLWAMKPSILGVPSQGMFARVWLIAPPADEIRALYGVVVYGPMANIYTLCRDVQFGDPFAWELRAYQKEVRVYAGVSKYMRWRDGLLGELRPDISDRRIGMYGVYAVRESRQSGLWVCETSPRNAMRVLSGNGELVVPLPSSAPEFAYAVRFENWVESLQSEVEHSRFLEQARGFDEDMERLRSSG